MKFQNKFKELKKKYINNIIMSYLAAFNNHLKEFVNDLVIIFPNDINIKSAKSAVGALTYANPKALVKVWKSYAFKYNDEIENGNIDFFINKDYGSDLQSVENSSKAQSIIEQLREPVRNLDDNNKQKAMKYIQNLNKLCNLYFSQ